MAKITRNRENVTVDGFWKINEDIAEPEGQRKALKDLAREFADEGGYFMKNALKTWVEDKLTRHGDLPGLPATLLKERGKNIHAKLVNLKNDNHFIVVLDGSIKVDGKETTQSS